MIRQKATVARKRVAGWRLALLGLVFLGAVASVVLAVVGVSLLTGIGGPDAMENFRFVRRPLNNPRGSRSQCSVA